MNTSSSETRHNLCKRQFSDGRRCRMLRMEGHPHLCPFHVREEKQLIEADKLGEELASLSGNLNNGTDIMSWPKSSKPWPTAASPPAMRPPSPTSASFSFNPFLT
jgi:hypothetical protein